MYPQRLTASPWICTHMTRSPKLQLGSADLMSSVCFARALPIATGLMASRCEGLLSKDTFTDWPSYLSVGLLTMIACKRYKKDPYDAHDPYTTTYSNEKSHHQNEPCSRVIQSCP